MNDEIVEVIISPHPDDEIIGLYERLIKRDNKIIIVYTENIDEIRKKECLSLKNYLDNISAQFFNASIPPSLLNPKNIFYFPDHIYENHPAHRIQGQKGEELARKGLTVIFYSTNMKSPYIHEVKDFKGKRHLLEKVYPSQKSLWKNDHRYFLFEGKCSWIF